MTQYAASKDGIEWKGKYANENTAISTFAEEQDLQAGSHFFIAKVVEYSPVVDIDCILEQVADRGATQFEELANSGWLENISIDHKTELAVKITKTFRNWMNRRGYRAPIWNVTDVTKVLMPERTNGKVIQKKVK